MSRAEVLPASLARSLGGPQGGGVFYLHGEDEFRKEEIAQLLVNVHLEEGIRDFNLDPVRGPDLDASRLESLVATPPMMAPWRVVVVREAEALARSPRTRDAVLALLDAPPAEVALILLARKPQGSTAKFYRELERRARSLEFRAISANDAPGWLQARAQQLHGVIFEEDAARGLAAALGTELGVLAQELDKLAARVGEGGVISISVVEEAGTRLPAVDRWKWIDGVGRRDVPGALDDLPQLLAQGESGVGLVIALSTHLLRLAVARTSGKTGLEQLLGPRHRFLVGPLVSQSKRWEARELEEALMGLARADRRLKSGGMGDAHILEEWLLHLQVAVSSEGAR
ncbi:MAG: DNA polymerase III subunit delta [Gemmatimonadota bacterium]